MKLFQKVLMASEDVQSLARPGKFYAEENIASIDDGAVVVMGGFEDHEVYAGMKDLNVRKMTAPEADTDRVVVVDYVGVSEADVQGVRYRIGEKTAGIPAPAGAVVRTRTLITDDMFWVGADNFVSTPTVGQFAIPTASDTRWTPAASDDAPTKTTIEIIAEADIITGMVTAGKKYLCLVKHAN